MSHITKEQRYTISEMLKNGYSKQEIAKVINKHKSVIYRELARNNDGRNGKYRVELAQRKYEDRQQDKRKQIKFTDDVKVEVELLLREDYSPEQVARALKKQGKSCVSPERIYQHIWTNKKKGGDLHTHLRRQGRRYRKRGSSKDTRGIIKGRIGIEKRPQEVEERKRFGDLEVDLIIGKNHKEAIVTINDRASGMLKIKKVKSKESKEVSKVIIELLEQWMPYLHTMTSDNGKEFADHKKVSETIDIEFYFARQYHSWERGSNEKLNGLIRQCITKGCDFKNLTNEYISSVKFHNIVDGISSFWFLFRLRLQRNQKGEDKKVGYFCFTKNKNNYANLSF